MSNFIWPSISLYCLSGIFIVYQTHHAKHFKGGSEAFGLVLNLSAFLGTITRVIYLVYYGWTISWWTAIVIFLLGIFATVPGFIIERLIGKIALSLLGFIGWPLCAYFMFDLLPGSV